MGFVESGMTCNEIPFSENRFLSHSQSATSLASMLARLGKTNHMSTNKHNNQDKHRQKRKHNTGIITSTSEQEPNRMQTSL